jgi:inhibitor of KinA sporulation pathway (predicted exonuclease)
MYICIITSEIIFKDYSKNRLIDELIEFTSILLKEEDDNIEYIEIYHKYIKPMQYMDIENECWKEKGIHSDIIKKEGISFEEFIEDYYQWIYKYKQSNDILIVITLDSQISNLLEERCKKMDMNPMKDVRRYYTIKDINRIIFLDNGNSTLAVILFKLGLSLHMRHSGCIDDCRSIANIIEKIYLENDIYKLNFILDLSKI